MDFMHLILLVFIEIVNTSHELNNHPEGITHLLDKLITETQNRNFSNNVTETFGESDKELPNKSFKNVNDSNIVYLKTPLIHISEDVPDKVQSIENTRRNFNSDNNYDDITETVIEEHSSHSENVGDLILEKEVTIDFLQDLGAPSNITDQSLFAQMGRRGLSDEQVNLNPNRIFKYAPRVGLEVENNNKSTEVIEKAFESDLKKVLNNFNNILQEWENLSENKSDSGLKKLLELIQNQSNKTKHESNLKNSELQKDLIFPDRDSLETYNAIPTSVHSKSGDTFNDPTLSLEYNHRSDSNQYDPPHSLNHKHRNSHPTPYLQYRQPTTTHNSYDHSPPNHQHNNSTTNNHPPPIHQNNYPTPNEEWVSPDSNSPPNHQYNHLPHDHHYNHSQETNEESHKHDIDKLIGESNVLNDWFKNQITNSNKLKLSQNTTLPKNRATQQAVPIYKPNVISRPLINVFHHNLRYPAKRYRLPLRPTTLFPTNFNSYYEIPQKKKCCTHGLCVSCNNMNPLIGIVPERRMIAMTNKLMTGYVYNPVNPMYYERYI